MRIGELARRVNVSTSRIRFYEARGLLAKAERGGNGYRVYPENAVEILRLIDEAQDLGFSLGEIKAGLAQAEPGLPSKGEMLDALRSKLASLDLHIGEITRRRERVVAMIREFEDKYVARPAGGRRADARDGMTVSAGRGRRRGRAS